MKFLLCVLFAASLVLGLGSAPSATRAQTGEAMPPEPGMEFPEEGAEQDIQGDMEMSPDDGIELPPDEMMPEDGMAMPPDEMPPDEQTDGD
jgi:hypothetical protein